MLKWRASLNGELEAKIFWFDSRSVRFAGFGLQEVERCYEVVFVGGSESVASHKNVKKAK